MRQEIENVLTLLDVAFHKVRQLNLETREHEGDDWVWAQVDLGHAERHITDAKSKVARLIVNGRKPWDDE